VSIHATRANSLSSSFITDDNYCCCLCDAPGNSTESTGPQFYHTPCLPQYCDDECCQDHFNECADSSLLWYHPSGETAAGSKPSSAEVVAQCRKQHKLSQDMMEKFETLVAGGTPDGVQNQMRMAMDTLGINA